MAPTASLVYGGMSSLGESICSVKSHFVNIRKVITMPTNATIVTVTYLLIHAIYYLFNA